MARKRKWFFPAGMIEEVRENSFQWWSIGEDRKGKYELMRGPFIIEDGIGYLLDGDSQSILTDRDSGRYWYRSLPRFNRCHIFTRERQASCSGESNQWFCQHGIWKSTLDELVRACPEASFDRYKQLVTGGDTKPIFPIHDVFPPEDGDNGILEAAIGIAIRAHEGQRDKAGQPYILHPLRVMLKVDTVEERIVAILHDVLEDGTDAAQREVEDLLSDRLMRAVRALTKRLDEHGAAGYGAFIRRANKNPIARRVKIADLEDNLDITRLASLSASDSERLGRYHASLRFLKGLDLELNLNIGSEEEQPCLLPLD